MTRTGLLILTLLACAWYSQVLAINIATKASANAFDSILNYERKLIEKGNYQQAITVAQISDSLKQIYINETYDSAVAFHNKQLNMIDGATRNKVLITSNMVLEKKAERLKKNILLIGALLFSIAMLLALVIYQNRLQRKRHQVMLELNKANTNHKAELEKLNCMLSLQSLTAQMDPHFLFNVLGAIRFCIDENNLDDASRYAIQLKTLFKHAEYHNHSELITLDREIEFITQYIELENMRLKNTLEYKITVDAYLEPNKTYFATMMLQPLIENAIWHGLSKKEGNKHLEITINKSSDFLEVSITDNGIGRNQASLMSKGNRHQSKALNNLHERLKYYQSEKGKQGSLEITDLLDKFGNATGTSCIVLFPLNPKFNF